MSAISAAYRDFRVSPFNPFGAHSHPYSYGSYGGVFQNAACSTDNSDFQQPVGQSSTAPSRRSRLARPSPRDGLAADQMTEKTADLVRGSVRAGPAATPPHELTREEVRTTRDESRRWRFADFVLRPSVEIGGIVALAQLRGRLARDTVDHPAALHSRAAGDRRGPTL